MAVDESIEDPGQLVERALRSVLDAVPGSGDAEEPTTVQPWAEVAAPPGKNKRPLQDLLDEYAARVAAAPEATASHPSDRHPAVAFFDRFAKRGAGQARPAGQRGRGRSASARAGAPPRDGTRDSTRPPRGSGGTTGTGSATDGPRAARSEPRPTTPAGGEGRRRRRRSGGNRRRGRRGGNGETPATSG